MAGEGGLSETTAHIAGAVTHELPDGPRVVALSGGADSAVCAWAASRDERHPLRAIHVHHGLDHSDAMSVAAQDVAELIGLDIDRLDVEVPGGPSPEDQARRVRHESLEGAIKPDEWLLSGHTQDDQAETVLANMLRGAGAGGLAGIPRRRGRWVRPMLGLARDDVRRAADELGLPYIDDPANADPQPLRNRLRRELIPRLEQEFSPALKALLARTAQLLAADDDLLEVAAARVPFRAFQGGIKLPAPALVTMPAPMAARTVRRALREVRGPHAGTAEEVTALLAVAAGAPTVTIGHGLEGTREGPWLVVAEEGGTPAPVDLRVPGETALWAGTLMARVTDPAPRPWPIGRDHTVLDGAIADQPLSVRPAATGDRIDIGGGRKRVVAALAESGVPKRLRSSWPVLETDGNIAWLVGVRPATWAAARSDAASFLVLRADLEER